MKALLFLPLLILSVIWWFDRSVFMQWSWKGSSGLLYVYQGWLPSWIQFERILIDFYDISEMPFELLFLDKHQAILIFISLPFFFYRVLPNPQTSASGLSIILISEALSALKFMGWKFMHHFVGKLLAGCATYSDSKRAFYQDPFVLRSASIPQCLHRCTSNRSSQALIQSLHWSPL